ncbi:MAG: nuclear transport factor 2 family protein [Caulobacterales bacterium]|nr:nuclear transport factor 2 family protein [Caulobacterales bacterium]
MVDDHVLSPVDRAARRSCGKDGWLALGAALVLFLVSVAAPAQAEITYRHHTAPVTLTAEQSRQSAVMHQFLQALLDGDVGAWVALFSQDAVMEFPYAPPGNEQRLAGREQIAAYISDMPEELDFIRFDDVVIHHSASDPDWLTIEFSAEAKALTTELPYNPTYISLVKIVGGEIERYRDYWNPLVAQEAFGGADSLQRTFSAGDKTAE